MINEPSVVNKKNLFKKTNGFRSPAPELNSNKGTSWTHVQMVRYMSTPVPEIAQQTDTMKRREIRP
jgi:hypothetical protein